MHTLHRYASGRPRERMSAVGALAFYAVPSHAFRPATSAPVGSNVLSNRHPMAMGSQP